MSEEFSMCHKPNGKCCPIVVKLDNGKFIIKDKSKKWKTHQMTKKEFDNLKLLLNSTLEIKTEIDTGDDDVIVGC
jgi:hypothetical protein